MWKSLVSSGHQATKASTTLQPSIGLWTPPVKPVQSVGIRNTFSTLPIRQKEAPEPGTPSDREALNPDRAEVSKSGTDSELAEHPAAFDPHNTSPEGEFHQTAKESKEQGKAHNPLNMSPANSEVSDWKRPDGPERNIDREASSTRGSPRKSRSIHVKEDGTHVSYRD